jgi:hypothetical protein
VNSSGSSDTWTYGTGTNQRIYTLTIDGAIPGPTPSTDPIRFISDYRATLSATFATPVPQISFNGSLGWMTNLFVCLELERAPTTNDPIYTISVTRPGRSATGTFRTPFYAQNIIIKTIPLLKWLHGSVSGFTPEPLQAQDYYALTFLAGHHNFFNDFIVDPTLEPSLTTAQRADLASQNIRLFYGHTQGFGPGGGFYILGLDGTVRSVP